LSGEGADIEKPLSIRNELTFREAFRFPVHSPLARRELLIGAALLLIPFVGWVLNMGHRLHLVHHMLAGRPAHPAWSDWRSLFVRGLVATLVIIIAHLPGGSVIAVALMLDSLLLTLIGVILLLMGVFVLPGFMTFYAREFDSRVLLNPVLAIRRVLNGGSVYFKAWMIGLTAWALAFLGLLVFGLGFLLTSVWFWQVAAFAFASAMVKAHDLPAETHPV